MRPPRLVVAPPPPVSLLAPAGLALSTALLMRLPRGDGSCCACGALRGETSRRVFLPLRCRSAGSAPSRAPSFRPPAALLFGAVLSAS